MNLYIIPTPINPDFGINNIAKDVLDKVYQCHCFFAENAKTARVFLKAINHPIIIQEITIFSIDRDSGIHELKKVIAEKKYKNIGLLSECGCPVVADPGSELIRYAHKNNINVYPLSGASSITQSLMASGFGGQNFAFHGYLAHNSIEKIENLRKFLNRARIENESQIFIETPYRTVSLINFFIGEKEIFLKVPNLSKTITQKSKHNKVNKKLYLCVAASLLCDDELIISKPLIDWSPAEAEKFKGKPAVFLLAYN